MRVDTFGEIPDRCAHFDGQDAFTDELPCPMANNAYAEDALCLGINDKFGQPVSPVKSQCPPGGTPGEFGYFDGNSLGFGFRFSQPTPTQLRVGENDCRDDRLKHALLTC